MYCCATWLSAKCAANKIKVPDRIPPHMININQSDVSGSPENYVTNEMIILMFPELLIKMEWNLRSNKTRGLRLAPCRNIISIKTSFLFLIGSI